MDKNGKMDYTEPIELTKGVYWLGFHEEKVGFQCNPYAIIDGDEVIVFDPGNNLDYPKVAAKLFSIVDPDQISYIVLHHQDPDFCSSGPLLEEVITNKDLRIATHSFSSLFTRYYGFKHPFYLIDKQKDKYEITLKSGNKLKFIHTPFCHSPGAFTTYYESRKVLFSSDIFGCVSTGWNFFADENYLERMKAFHMGYMASNRHLNNVMDDIKKLDLDMILPQHGSIIRKEMIPKCIKFLKELNCGIDLKDKDEAYNWTGV